MTNYFIYRAGEQSDPTSSLEFCPSKDSDELFFALKSAYPHVKTHSERMRNAVIEFLIKERDEEQMLSQMAPPPLPVESSYSYDAESPWSSFPSISSISTLSSPDMVNLATPASMSSSGFTPTMSRQSSQAQAAPSSNKRPVLEDMTGVFSLSSDSQPKTRIRRKMTDSEKAEYRKRRIVKACESCSKRKRKCSHNQTDMEKVQSAKVTKTKAPASNIRADQLERALVQHTEPGNLTEDPFLFLDQSLFSELPAADDSLFNVNSFENLFAPKAIAQQPQRTVTSASTWPWCDTQDFTLLEAPLQTQAPAASPAYDQVLFPVSNGGLISPEESPEESPLIGFDIVANQNRSESERGVIGRQTPTRTWRSFPDFSRTAFSTADGLDGKEMPLRHNAPAVTTGDMASPTQFSYVLPTLAPLTGLSSLSTVNSAGAQPLPQANATRITPNEDLHGSTVISQGPRMPIVADSVLASGSRGDGAASPLSLPAQSAALLQGHSSQHSLATSQSTTESTVQTSPRSESSGSSSSSLILLSAQASPASSSGHEIAPRPITRNSARRLGTLASVSEYSQSEQLLTLSNESGARSSHGNATLVADDSGSSPRSICPDTLGSQPLQRHRHKDLAPPSGEGLSHGLTSLATGYSTSVTDIAVTVFMAQLSSTWRLMTHSLVQAMCLTASKSCKPTTFAPAGSRHASSIASFVAPV